MKKLVLAVFIGLSAVCASVLSAAQQQGLGSIFEGDGIERMVHCYWLATDIDVTQSEESDSSSKSKEEEEPDCE